MGEVQLTLMGLRWMHRSRSFTSHSMFCSLCSKKRGCVYSVQQFTLPDVIKGDSVVAGNF